MSDCWWWWWWQTHQGTLSYIELSSETTHMDWITIPMWYSIQTIFISFLKFFRRIWIYEITNECWLFMEDKSNHCKFESTVKDLASYWHLRELPVKGLIERNTNEKLGAGESLWFDEDTLCQKVTQNLSSVAVFRAGSIS